MSYKTIGIVVTDEVSDLAALDAAVALAARSGGHLDVYCLGLDPIRYDMAPLGSTPAIAMSGAGEAKARATELVAWAEGRLRNVDVPNAVQPLMVTTVALESAITRVVRYNDLIVASQPYGSDSTQLQVSVLESALFGTGAPVLVVPRTALDYARPFERAMIAWNESAESLEAIRKAMPVLEEADRAEIVMIDPPSHSPERSDPGGAICVMLARRGIKAEVSILSKTLPRVSEVINRHAKDQSNDLIVMGAYGHSRFREALIGGATRDMLESAEVPVLMAH